MSGNGTLKNFKAMLADAKRPEKTVNVCLRGDLAAEYEDLESSLEEAQGQAGDSLDAGVGDIAENLEAMRELMKEYTYPFRLRALSRPAFRALVAEHPPRRQGDAIDERDVAFMVNLDTFNREFIKLSVVSPEMDEDDWTSLLDDKLTDAQFENLAVAAWMLNRVDVDIPFSHAASRPSRASAPE
jgi:hypothetical protein